ncbi:cardiolipin synthase (CMP-forming) like protein [Verticillium longisporum]|nr:cardiolipin synthase (CMP-forming) like protein [Verticillium longisporum]
MAILTVSLAVQGSLPVWLAVIILGRDVGLAIAAIYYRWVSLPPPKTFTRYWDFSLPSAEVHPTAISKYNTFLQLALIGLTTAAPVIAHDISVPLTAMQYIVATTTIWSGASYIYTKDALRRRIQPEGIINHNANVSVASGQRNGRQALCCSARVDPGDNALACSFFISSRAVNLSGKTVGIHDIVVKPFRLKPDDVSLFIGKARNLGLKRRTVSRSKNGLPDVNCVTKVCANDVVCSCVCLKGVGGCSPG